MHCFSVIVFVWWVRAGGFTLPLTPQQCLSEAQRLPGGLRRRFCLTAGRTATNKAFRSLYRRQKTSELPSMGIVEFPAHLIRVLYSFIFRLIRSVLVTVAFCERKEGNRRERKAGVRWADVRVESPNTAEGLRISQCYLKTGYMWYVLFLKIRH